MLSLCTRVRVECLHRLQAFAIGSTWRPLWHLARVLRGEAGALAPPAAWRHLPGLAWPRRRGFCSAAVSAASPATGPSLMIVESPTKAKKIGEYLGRDYKVRRATQPALPGAWPPGGRGPAGPGAQRGSLVDVCRAPARRTLAQRPAGLSSTGAGHLWARA
jgi:hypothetical protein